MLFYKYTDKYKHEYRYKLVAGMAVVVVGINIVKVEDRALLRPLKWKIRRPAALPAPDSSDQGGRATIPYSNRSPTVVQRCSSSDRATSLVQGLQPPAKLFGSCLSIHLFAREHFG